MKGLVFNLLADLVQRHHGEAAWDALLERSGLDGAYTTLGNYPHQEMHKLVTAASELLGTPRADILRWFGKTVLADLAKSFPQLFAPHHDTRSFLLTLNDVIHPEVRKLYPGADAPSFDFSTGPDGALLLGYDSKRQLCEFGAGLIEGAAAHYGEAVELSQPSCALRGDPKCVFSVRVSPTAK